VTLTLLGEATQAVKIGILSIPKCTLNAFAATKQRGGGDYLIVKVLMSPLDVLSNSLIRCGHVPQIE
jgi:hypothetical protein